MEIEPSAKKELVKLIKNDESVDKDALLCYAFYLLINGKTELDYYFAYSIVVHFAVQYNESDALYEFALLFGYSPLLDIIKKNGYENNINIKELVGEVFVNDNIHNGKILTSGQKIIYRLINFNNDYSLVAPTSYGKTDLMIESAFRAEGDVIIIVPLVALLNQVKLDIIQFGREHNVNVKVITHYEIRRSSNIKNIYVLTQERCFQLIKNKELNQVSDVYIDEAHKLLLRNKRAYKLSEIIVLLKDMYKVRVNYYSPVLNSANSVCIKGMYKEKIYSVENIRDMKHYDYFLLIDNKKYLYMPNTERLSKDFICDDGYIDKFDYLLKNSKGKNLVFLNSPKEIEDVALRLADIIGENTDVGVDEIKEFVGEEYRLFDVIKSGIIYVHAQMPELIRMYLIKLYRQSEDIKYFITNSSILEGVNTPSDILFIFDYKIGRYIMKPIDFVNLRGRVNRISDLVKEKNISRIVSEIHFVCSSLATARKVRKEIIDPCYRPEKEDEITNEYIQNFVGEKEAEFIESLSRIKLIDDKLNIEEVYDVDKIKEIESEFVKICIANDIRLSEEQRRNIEKRLNKYENAEINDIFQLLKCIAYVFMLEKDEEVSLSRLSIEKVQKFYSTLLNWLIEGKTIKEKAQNVRNYYLNQERELIYVGSGRGEVCAETVDGKIEIRESGWSTQRRDKKGNFVQLKKAWVINSKNSKDLYNIAIVKIKIEEDFISYNLCPFIESLYQADKGIISTSLYNLIKYKTDNEREIELIKEGVSIYLARKLVEEKYSKYVHLGEDGIKIDNSIYEVFAENDIIKSELVYFTH